MWYVHTIIYYLAIIKNNRLINTRAWIDLKNIMLSERRQTQKNKFYIIPLHEILRWAKLICSNKKQISVYIHPGEGVGCVDSKDAHKHEWASVARRRRRKGQWPLQTGSS